MVGKVFQIAVAGAFLLGCAFVQADDDGGRKNCPHGLDCVKEARVPNAQSILYKGASPLCDYLPLLSNPNALILFSPADLGSEYTVWNSIMQVIATYSGTLETPFFIRMATFHSVTPFNALTTFYQNVEPVMFEPIAGLFPFANPVPSQMNTTVNRNIAVAFTMQRLVEYFYPDSVISGVSGILASLGLDPTYTGASSVSDARDIGNIAAAATIEWSKHDGFNFESVEWSQWKHVYSDNGNFMPTNTAYQLTSVNQWQPLLETRDDGSFFVQTMVAAQAGAAGKTVGLSDAELQNMDASSFVPIKSTGSFDDPLSPSELRAYKAQADEVLWYSANLNDTSKMVAEFFDRKFVSFGTAPFASYFDPKKMDSLIKYLAIDMHHLAIHDAMIVAWKEKTKLNKVRPINAIRYLYGKTNVTAYAGPGQGTKSFDGSEWRGYLRTMPHAEFPSLTCCVCVSYAEWIERFFGTPGHLNNFTWTFGAGCSVAEPGTTPAAAFTKVWDNKEQFIQECCDARVHAGVHFKPSCDATASFCRGVGQAVWEKVGSSIRVFM